MRFLFNELLLRNHKKLAEEILVTAKPPVQEDRVFVYVAVEGWKTSNKLEREEFVRDYRAIEILGKKRNAIAWTTAASVCAVVEMVNQGKLPDRGFLKQENIKLNDFLKTKNGHYFSD
jgi:saccharopine dehydrogenase-like NADP-dependent oxidoreductase